ncbi:MAG: hypothetical protein GC193_14695 [Cryomorphaceae bacterium]|nr:hypothetical protein [Cryomorphaceae bacterium]
MKTTLHTTNYISTFIEVSEDCPSQFGEVPVSKGDKKTVAEMQFEIISKHPYQFTSDDLLFDVYARKMELLESEYEEARNVFFSKGQPCLRASPLTKRFGFGVHLNKEGKIAIFGRETNEYQHFLNDANLKKVKAMKSSKK